MSNYYMYYMYQFVGSSWSSLPEQIGTFSRASIASSQILTRDGEFRPVIGFRPVRAFKRR
mgnify:CR=1 FL=1